MYYIYDTTNIQFRIIGLILRISIGDVIRKEKIKKKAVNW